MPRLRLVGWIQKRLNGEMRPVDSAVRSFGEVSAAGTYLT
jgi:hypothetical protein